MYSFRPVLMQWMKITRARRVWEWGPGESSRLILDALPADGLLRSVEHDKRYAVKLLESLAHDARWTLHQRHIGRVSTYATSILENDDTYDLIFVDGRRRVECCLAAFHRLAPSGVMLLHDASRSTYRSLIDPFIEPLAEERQTLVFRPLLNRPQ
jgi:predicted O-methyltransferase YrrM